LTAIALARASGSALMTTRTSSSLSNTSKKPFNLSRAECLLSLRVTVSAIFSKRFWLFKESPAKNHCNSWIKRYTVVHYSLYIQFNAYSHQRQREFFNLTGPASPVNIAQGSQKMQVSRMRCPARHERLEQRETGTVLCVV